MILESAEVGQLLLVPRHWDGRLNLALSRIKVLFTADGPPGPLDAAGWEIGDLHGPLRQDWKLANEWLATGAAGKDYPVSVQPWLALAEVYAGVGEPAQAKRMRIAAAHQVTRRAPGPTRLGRWIYWAVAGYGYRPLLAFVWMLVLLAGAFVLVVANKQYIVPTDTAAANTAIERHVGITATTTGADLAAKQQQARALLPVTGRTPCEVLKPYYSCMHSAGFVVNAVLPPAAATNTRWEPSAATWLTLGLPTIKLALWALTALLIAGLTGLLHKD